MLPKVNPTTTAAWQQLEEHYSNLQSSHIRQLFAIDPERFKKFSLCAEDLVFDYSKNILTSETITLLVKLATECGLGEAIEAMFKGEKINQTEKRAVLHTALSLGESEIGDWRLEIGMKNG